MLTSCSYLQLHPLCPLQADHQLALQHHRPTALPRYLWLLLHTTLTACCCLCCSRACCHSSSTARRQHQHVQAADAGLLLGQAVQGLAGELLGAGWQGAVAAPAGGDLPAAVLPIPLHNHRPCRQAWVQQGEDQGHRASMVPGILFTPPIGP